MIIRRLRLQAARHNWFGVAVDLAILILGVFLGIQVNNWNQERIERNKGAEYRERLAEDMAANVKDLSDRRAYYSVTRDYAQAALDALDHAQKRDPAAFLVDAYQASQITPRKMRRFTYDEVLSTGNVENLGDAEFREHLANYYSGLATIEITFDNVPPYREHIRTGMPSRAQQAVRTQCAEIIRFDPQGTTVAYLPANCAIRLDPSEAAEDARAVRAIPGIKGDLARLIADLDVKLLLVDTFQKRAGDMRRRIREDQRA